MRTEKEVDMGGTFDWFGPESHPDYKEGLTPEQYANRMILREAMLRHGFKPLETELFQLPGRINYFHFLEKRVGETTSENQPQWACWPTPSCLSRAMVSVPIM